LRAIRCANAYSDAHSYSNRNSNGHTHLDADRYSHGYGDGNAYANCDAMHGQMYTNAQASPDPGTSPVGLT
jgi:hypothetical protein